MSFVLSRSFGVSARGASRRSFVALSALTGLGLPVLAGCDLPGVSKDKGGSASPSGSTASAGGSASASGPAKAGSTDWQKLDAHVMGHKVSVEVSPVVRQDDKTSYIALKLTRASDDASIGLLGVFRTVLVLCFRLPSSGPGNRFRPRRECDTLGLSEDEYDCISVRSMRQYRLLPCPSLGIPSGTLSHS